MTITILFPNGKEISVKCNSVDTERDTKTGGITNLHFKGIKENKIIDGLEMYTAGKLKKARVYIIVEKLQKYIVDCVDKTELLKAMDSWDKFGNDPNEGLILLSTPALQDRYVPYIKYDDMVKCVENMPSVTPQELCWIPVNDSYEDDKRLKEIQDEAHGSLNALMATLYNKGYQDGEKALAEHHKLCRNEADGTDEVLDKIRAEIIKYERDCRLTVDDYTCSRCTDDIFNSIYNIIDKYKVGSEET